LDEALPRKDAEAPSLTTDAEACGPGGAGERGAAVDGAARSDGGISIRGGGGGGGGGGDGAAGSLRCCAAFWPVRRRAASLAAPAMAEMVSATAVCVDLGAGSCPAAAAAGARFDADLKRAAEASAEVTAPSPPLPPRGSLCGEGGRAAVDGRPAAAVGCPVQRTGARALLQIESSR